MKSSLRFYKQSKHLLSKLGLVNLEKGNFAQHLTAQRRKVRLNAKDDKNVC